MEDADRRTLQLNRVFLVKNIANPDDIAEGLYSREIFTEGMKDEIEVEKLREKKVRKLLDVIPRRGPDAFVAFLDVLLETKNEHIANHLKSGISVQNKSNHQQDEPEEDLPQTWPDPLSLEGPLTVKVITTQNRRPKPSWCYKMGKKPRGRVLVINNKIFFGPLEEDQFGRKRVILPTREGTEQDQRKIEEVFKQLNFTVDVFQDKKGEDIRDILQQEVKRDFHREAECFVLVIMTHGTHGAIYGVDGKTIPIEEIKRQINGEGS